MKLPVNFGDWSYFSNFKFGISLLIYICNTFPFTFDYSYSSIIFFSDAFDYNDSSLITSKLIL